VAEGGSATPPRVLCCARGGSLLRHLDHPHDWARLLGPAAAERQDTKRRGTTMRAERWCITAIVAALLVAPAQPARAVTQTQLDPSTLTKYLDPLPAPAIVDGTKAQTVTVSEFTQQVLPSNFKAGPYGGKTLVWGYNGSYPGPTIEVKRTVPFQVTFVNNLVNPALLPYLPIDQTLHWADPLGCGQTACAGKPYTGPVPIVTHLHGGEVPSAYDGNPEAWYTSGASPLKGKAFVSSTYVYPNSQEATTLWYHDHTLGITRLNVYAGLAGFYLLRDAAKEPSTLPSGAYERAIVIQDRMFDTNGQLFYPVDSSSHSNHPFWIDNFQGNTIVVNGKAWPYLNVEPRRYRFRFLNGSNSRIYTLQLVNTNGSLGPVFWQIGTDGGLLDKPIQVTQLTIAPGERADMIVDFTGVASGTSFILKNGNSGGHSTSYRDSSYSSRYSGSSSTTGEIMKVNVSLPLSGTDSSLNPATLPNLRPNNPMVKLSPTVNSTTPIRGMTLEHGNDEFLLNGLHWIDPATETPRVGATEVWNLENRTGDTHPIHLHLVQFQVQSGSNYGGWGGSSSSDPTASGWKDTIPVQGWNSVTVVARWAPQSTPAGGVNPGQNLYPFDPTAIQGTTDQFGNPGGAGYVWHCHILEHEDNEMMRPQIVQP
jgi:FtsP/CotA-like multicopper oxidase with cupredoxin domain